MYHLYPQPLPQDDVHGPQPSTLRNPAPFDHLPAPHSHILQRRPSHLCPYRSHSVCFRVKGVKEQTRRVVKSPLLTARAMTGARIKAERALEMGGSGVGVIRVFRQLPYLRREQQRRERLYRLRYFQCRCIFGVGNTIISIILIISPSLSLSGSGLELDVFFLAGGVYLRLQPSFLIVSPNHIKLSSTSPSHSEPSPVTAPLPNSFFPGPTPTPTPPTHPYLLPQLHRLPFLCLT
ncbi:hypothetical protein GYMLUDRAFT_487461 [Collybiopsis luxurians FD-317 M1]|uniref:Uncharacterized protein n=1 Tax=Collybiopsis luxurians FD-317 M1 TaxID=944289 RepID=A0A0D0BL57_9AGAR|nr:hypothetical protein GYMLUDRAFT_487461 [Collybiopsis luxurians FD-317 M1]